jgi:tetraacyldisaccharide 4'-kinase
LKKIKKIALKNKLEIITTEKDYKRLTNNNRKNVKYLKVELKIENLKKFYNFLKKTI